MNAQAAGTDSNWMIVKYATGLEIILINPPINYPAEGSSGQVGDRHVARAIKMPMNVQCEARDKTASMRRNQTQRIGLRHIRNRNGGRTRAAVATKQKAHR